MRVVTTPPISFSIEGNSIGELARGRLVVTVTADSRVSGDMAILRHQHEVQWLGCHRPVRVAVVDYGAAAVGVGDQALVGDWRDVRVEGVCGA
jgi:hypothetical protein